MLHQAIAIESVGFDSAYRYRHDLLNTYHNIGAFNIEWICNIPMIDLLMLGQLLSGILQSIDVSYVQFVMTYTCH